MKKSVVIYGYSILGSKIAKVLDEKGYKVIVISFVDEQVIKAKKDGYEVINSTLLNDDELLEIGIGKDVDSLFCVSNSNKNNLFVTLSARNLDKNLKIISTSKTKAEAKKLLIAGATKVLNPNELTAQRIYRYMTKPLMLKVLDEILFSKSDLNISEIYINKESMLNGKFLKDITIHKKYNILLIGIMDKELGEQFIFNTKGINHKIDEGDILVVVGQNAELVEFREYIGGVGA
ncbi:NAD-binding protein [Halarcobacter sp.]|uniref:potassium channel family protein n=1 Tax=Halarcobacter sp. TaxID=2321133 RepID=UPI0029F5411D|nr:NAD-binding protein [Halarcobacter sp.]